METNILASNIAQPRRGAESGIHSHSGENQDIWQACLEKFLIEKYEAISLKKTDTEISNFEGCKSLHDQIGYFAV